MMELNFKLTRKDYLEFLKSVYPRMLRMGNGNKKMRFINFVVWVFIGLGFSFLFGFYNTSEGVYFKQLNLALMFLCVGLVGHFASAAYLRSYFMHYALSEQGPILNDQKISLSEDAIQLATQNSKHIYSWSAILDVEETSNLICMHIDNAQALLVPKRVFENVGLEKEFVSFIKSRTGSSH